MKKLKTYTHCIRCGAEKQIPKHVARPATAPSKKARKPSVYASRLTYEQDPYCSTVCCRLDHGVSSSTGMTSS